MKLATLALALVLAGCVAAPPPARPELPRRARVVVICILAVCHHVAAVEVPTGEEMDSGGY